MEPQRFVTQLKRNRKKHLAGIIFMLVASVVFLGVYGSGTIRAVRIVEDTGTRADLSVNRAAFLRTFTLFFACAVGATAGWLIGEITKSTLTYVVLDLWDRVQKLEHHMSETMEKHDA
jgi:hypothetical protein